MKPQFPVWGVILLLFNVGAAFLLTKICFAYFSMFTRSALLSSLIDSRGGLWELQMVVPFLLLVTVIGNWMLPPNKAARKISLCSVMLASASGLGCFVLAHFIWTSLRAF